MKTNSCKADARPMEDTKCDMSELDNNDIEAIERTSRLASLRSSLLASYGTATIRPLGVCHVFQFQPVNTSALEIE